jgi:hypothetical protein
VGEDMDDVDVDVPECVLSPSDERRRSRALAVLIEAGLAVLGFGPTLLTQARSGDSEPTTWTLALGRLGSIVPVMWPFHAADGFGPLVVIGGRPAHLLTGRTLTGRRSVDLSELTTVRYRWKFGR